MSDSKGHYSPVNTSEDSQPQPPAYTPSTGPSSPYIHPHQAGTSAAPSSGLYPQLDHSAGAPSAPYQPTYQHPKFHDPSKPPPHVPQYVQQQQQPHASCMASPLILMRPPSRIQDLKAKPGVVVCQHCSYLVLTETTPENGSCTYLGILGLLLAGVTSCGCCLLPLCVTSCKDIMHSCPSCHEDIGLYSRIKERTIPVERE
ncbi:lipopolysaccharide-induced tumor necrosis factor-alpha factor [Entomortierella parvispora]|uniref:Lipopolysaccharide-induced tumor necrosis factor-alpha factor n=1 Tax=Entomortierella parvispora TaxID=205924 RepID=A0A9P3LU26_9FUNG|nr:lipopolysaccharide-induced tumor necrosis factor-alpha factor [Entomortierella parvispora]